MNQQPWPGKSDSMAAWAGPRSFCPFFSFKTLKEGANKATKEITFRQRN
jgi:hypothetical protein